MLETIELNPKEKISHSIIWLHGLGADGNDFVDVVQHLPHRQTRYVFPHAPVQPVTVNGSFPMRAWYDITSFDAVGRESDKTGVGQSIAAINELIDVEMACGVAEKNIIIAGFSQGGAIALRVALQRSSLNAVMALSTYLLFTDNVPLAKTTMPFLLMHGDQDPIIPFALGEEARQCLTAKQYHVEFKSYCMAHQLSAIQISDIDTFLRQQGCE